MLQRKDLLRNVLMLYMTNTMRVAESPTECYRRSPHVSHMPDHARCTHPSHIIDCLII